MGPWESAPLDPSLWGFEGAPVTEFVVRDACLRLVRLRAAALCVGYAPRCALPPPLWGVSGAAAGAPNPLAVQNIANRQHADLLRKLPRADGRSVRPRGDGAWNVPIRIGRHEVDWNCMVGTLEGQLRARPHVTPSLRAPLHQGRAPTSL